MQNSESDITKDYNRDATGRLLWKKSIPIEQQMEELYYKIQQKNKGEDEFLQAVHEVIMSLKSVFNREPHYLSIMEQILEPERVIMFRVPWVDDQGVQHINRGFRVQYSSALGPYKGGLRFHPTVTLNVMKFLAFEQIFKNALTGLRIGGGKGGSDFDPRGRSDNEIMRFCQSFMTCLHEYIGHQLDVPAGDINVGQREICYLYGQYKRLKHSCDGCLTGKSMSLGGSYIRPEATGYGCVYFLMHWAQDAKIDIKGSKCVISGSGNVAQYVVEKLLQLGAKPLTMSDSSGYVYEPEGFTMDQFQHIQHLKNIEKKRISEYCQYSKTAKYISGKRPWEIKEYTFAFPCATQNEIEKEDAQHIVDAKCKAVVEGANMPTTAEAINFLQSKKVTVCPAKAANAGGVAVSALEMAQNESRCIWTREEVDEKLKKIMGDIYKACKAAAKKYDCEDSLIDGANIAGFLRVAEAVYQQGCV